MPKLSSDNPSDDLSEAISTLQSSLLILMIYYLPYLKVLGLALLGYLSYKFGDLSVSDRILSQQRQLNTLIHKRQVSRVQMPKRVKKLQSLNKIFLMLITVGMALCLFTYFSDSNYKKFVKKNLESIVGLFVTLAVIIAAINLYKLFLSQKIKSASVSDREIAKKLTDFTASLGSKVSFLLKHHLCKKKMQSTHKTSSNECQKAECKELRGLYKLRNDSISHLTEKIINFEWCSICKKRSSFDEYLPFEAPAPVQPEGVSEEQEVQLRISYLYEGLNRMAGWINEVSPCNCSKLYWGSSTKDILEFKQSEKKVNPRIAELEKKPGQLKGSL